MLGPVYKGFHTRSRNYIGSGHYSDVAQRDNRFTRVNSENTFGNFVQVAISHPLALARNMLYPLNYRVQLGVVRF